MPSPTAFDPALVKKTPEDKRKDYITNEDSKVRQNKYSTMCGLLDAGCIEFEIYIYGNRLVDCKTPITMCFLTSSYLSISTCFYLIYSTSWESTDATRMN